MNKIPYSTHYPSAARYLIESGLCATPRQVEKDFRWAEGVDIIYTLHGVTPAVFEEYADTFLLLAIQECARYKDYEYKFAGFDVSLGRLGKKAKDLPEIVTFQAAMNPDPDVMVYGEEALGYTVPQKYFLTNKVKDIKDLAKRYPNKLNKQTPYRVIRFFVSIREPKPGKRL